MIPDVLAFFASGTGRPQPQGPWPAPQGFPSPLPDPSPVVRWTDPPGWSREVPSSAMRRAQYRFRGPGGEAECAVFYFGPGQGGDAQANAERWAGQLAPSAGSSTAPHPATRKVIVNGLAVLLVEASGTYVGGMPGGPPGPAQPDFMLLGAIVAGPDANWFFKATGPRATLERHRTAFDRMVRSVRRDAPE